MGVQICLLDQLWVTIVLTRSTYKERADGFALAGIFHPVIVLVRDTEWFRIRRVIPRAE